MITDLFYVLAGLLVIVVALRAARNLYLNESALVDPDFGTQAPADARSSDSTGGVG